MEELHKNNNEAERLQEELTMRGKYYFKGFGNLIQAVVSDIDNSIVEKEVTSEAKQSIQENLNKMVELYQRIPFEQITTSPDYDLLLEIKEAISRLVLEVESVLNSNGNFNRSHMEPLIFIDKKGMEYRQRLETLLEQIRQQPGHEQDGFKVVDIHGKTWNNAI